MQQYRKPNNTSLSPLYIYIVHILYVLGVFYYILYTSLISV